MGKWVSVSEAARELNVSERTVWRRIEKGEIESRLEDGTKQVKLEIDTMTVTPTVRLSERVNQLESDNEWLRQKVDELQTELKAERERTESERQRGEQAKERSDTIILQLTRQLDQSQRLLEYHRDPFWRRWFRRKGREGKTEDFS